MLRENRFQAKKLVGGTALCGTTHCRNYVEAAAAAIVPVAFGSTRATPAKAQSR
jgi:hypothetical protein